MFLLFTSFLLVINVNTVKTNIANTSKASEAPINNHNEHYHINKFNQLADDDTIVHHTEDISDYVNEEVEDYDEDNVPEYEEGDYYENKEAETDEPHEKMFRNETKSTKSEDTTQESEDGGTKNNTGSTDLKWFNVQPATHPNEKKHQSQENIPTTTRPISNVSPPNGQVPNEAEIKNDSNIYSRIKNIKENANRLNNEKIIYEDEKFLLLKFKLTPLNDSTVQNVLHKDVIDKFQRRFKGRKNKDFSGLFDSSIFEEDDSFFDEFNSRERTNYRGRPLSKFKRPHLGDPDKNRQNYNNEYKQRKPYPPNKKEYRRHQGFWIGNKYYPYYGPGFGKKPSHHFDYDFSDEDDSDYSNDCSDKYDDDDDDDGDPGILYGRPGVSETPAVQPGDTGILYGRPGPSVVNIPGTGTKPPGVTTGNNTDVVLVVIAAQ